jgi:hypothetical protein
MTVAEEVVSRLAAFLHGLSGGTEKAGEYSLPNTWQGATGTPDDLLDYTSQDFVLPTDADALQINADGEADPVRTNSGILDFLGEVGSEALEEAASLLEHLGNDYGNGQPKERPFVMHQLPLGSPGFKAVRYNVPINAVQILRKDASRRYVRLVNVGTEGVLLRSESSVTGMPNYFTLPVSKVDGTGPWNMVQIDTTDEIWAMSPTTNNIVEIMTVFGEPSANEEA